MQVSYPHPDGPHSSRGGYFFELLWTSLLVQVTLNVSTPVHGEEEVVPPRSYVQIQSAACGRCMGYLFTPFGLWCCFVGGSGHVGISVLKQPWGGHRVHSGGR